MAEEKATAQIVEQVLGRLTQLRMELEPDGRAVLDELIVGPEAEVSAHQLAESVVSGVTFQLVGEEYRAVVM